MSQTDFQVVWKRKVCRIALFLKNITKLDDSDNTGVSQEDDL